MPYKFYQTNSLEDQILLQVQT